MESRAWLILKSRAKRLSHILLSSILLKVAVVAHLQKAGFQGLLSVTPCGKMYFPLAFHVTYWDYIGWKDPFGQRGFSQRQYDHLNAKNTGQVYTPQFVINGEEWRGWFARDLLLGFNRQEQEVGVLNVTVSEQTLKASFLAAKRVKVTL